MSIIYCDRDEDMQSLASLMSVNTIGDIAPLDDFEEEDCKYKSNKNIFSLIIKHIVLLLLF